MSDGPEIEELTKLIGQLHHFFMKHSGEAPIAITLNRNRSRDLINHLSDWRRVQPILNPRICGVEIRFEQEPRS